MSQYGNIDRAFAGMKAEHYQYPEILKSGVAVDEINFGKPVFSYLGDSEKCYNYYNDTCSLLFDADFVTSNSIVITVNGEATSAVAFTTDHDTTAALVVTAIKALEIEDNNGNTINPDCILDASDTNNRTFLIRGVGVDLVVSEAITGGGSQATGTPTYSSDQVFRGLARHKAKYIDNGDTDAKYVINDSISIVEAGFYWGVINNVTVQDLATCYIDTSGADKGNFTNAAGATCNCVFRSDNYTQPSLTDYLAVIQIKDTYKMNAVIAWA